MKCKECKWFKVLPQLTLWGECENEKIWDFVSLGYHDEFCLYEDFGCILAEPKE